MITKYDADPFAMYNIFNTCLVKKTDSDFFVQGTLENGGYSGQNNGENAG